MKVSELEGALLDRWVAKADGVTIIEKPDDADERTPRKNTAWMTDDKWFGDEPDRESKKLIRWGPVKYGVFDPSRSWDDAGPIIQRENISLSAPRPHQAETHWFAYHGDQEKLIEMTGLTPLIAAMRAYVASKFGDEVPDETTSPA